MAANVKRITIDYGVKGHTVYVFVRREADKYLINASDGTFGAAPANPYLALTESLVIKGRYEVEESRAVWNDGEYEIVAYDQVGGSPNPTLDTMIGDGSMPIVSDTEVHIGLLALASSLGAIKSQTDKFNFMTINGNTYPISVEFFPGGQVIADAGNDAFGFKTDLTSAVTDFYKGAWCIFTGGALAYSAPRRVSGYDGVEKRLSFTDALAGVPSPTDTFSLIIY